MAQVKRGIRVEGFKAVDSGRGKGIQYYSGIFKSGSPAVCCFILEIYRKRYKGRLSERNPGCAEV